MEVQGKSDTVELTLRIDESEAFKGKSHQEIAAIISELRETGGPYLNALSFLFQAATFGRQELTMIALNILLRKVKEANEELIPYLNELIDGKDSADILHEYITNKSLPQQARPPERKNPEGNDADNLGSIWKDTINRLDMNDL